MSAFDAAPEAEDAAAAAMEEGRQDSSADARPAPLRQLSASGTRAFDSSTLESPNFARTGIGESGGMRGKKSAKFRCNITALRPVAKADNSSDSKTKGISGSDPAASGASFVCRGLFLGGVRDAVEETLRKHQITHIVNLTPESRCERLAGFEYCFIPVLDHSDAPIRQHFEDAFAFIDQGRRGDGGVLVHCQRGVSRSATITIAYLMRCLRVPHLLARDVVKRRRPLINPNLGFTSVLDDFEREIDVDGSAPPASFASALAEWDLSTPLTAPPGEQPPEDDEPEEPGSPQTAPPFASLGFT